MLLPVWKCKEDPQIYLDRPICAYRFADSCESPDSRESFEGSQSELPFVKLEHYENRWFFCESIRANRRPSKHLVQENTDCLSSFKPEKNNKTRKSRKARKRRTQCKHLDNPHPLNQGGGSSEQPHTIRFFWTVHPLIKRVWVVRVFT